MLCIVCRVETLLKDKKIGEVLWELAATKYLQLVKKSLCALGYKAEKATLKMFRSGHATHMANEGRPLAVILQAGEWKSKAWLRYVDLNILEQNVLLQKSVDSDSEDEIA